MNDLESFEGLVAALRTEADQLVLVLRSIFSVPPAMPPKERLEKFNRALRAATVILGLQESLVALQEALEKAGEARARFVRAQGPGFAEAM